MATRFYLRESAAAPVSVAFDAAWDVTASPAAAKSMFLTQDAADTISATLLNFPSTTGQQTLHRQWVSEEMAAGKIFDTSVTYKAQAMVRESAANDNCFSQLGVRIVSSDGSTVRHTVLAVADYMGTEFNATARNKTFANGDAGTGSYTTVTGDRLVVEFGHVDSAGTSIEGRSTWGSDADAASDLPEDETTTTVTLRPWFECSLDNLFTSSATTLSMGLFERRTPRRRSLQRY